MKEKSVCLGCSYAKWDRYPSGRLDRRKSGVCTYKMDFSLPAAFFWVSVPKPFGGWINRDRLFGSDPTTCDFRKEEAK